MSGSDIGYYTLPVMLSFDGVDRKVNNALSKGLGAAGKKGGQDFGKQFTGASEAELKKLGDAYGKLADRQKDASGKMRAEEAKLEDLRKRGITSGARYVAQYERAEKAKRDEARATKTATDALKDYERAQKSAADAGGDVGKGVVGKLKGIAGATRSAGGSAATGFVEGFGGPIAQIGTKAGPIGLALAAVAGLGLAAGGLLAKNLAAGMEREQQNDLIQAKFGLDDRTMGTIASAAGKAYAKNFGESVQGNVEAAAAAMQNGLLPKGATEQQTQAAVAQLDTVAKVLGVEIPEAARSAGQLMRTGFAKDFNEAADLIVAGAHSGLNISQDWLDTVNEYSTQFRKLGVSGPEAMGLLSQAVQGGARDTDVAADALKEFSIRAIDGSKTTKQAFKDLGFNAHAMKEAFAQGGPAAHDALGQVLTALKQVEDPAKKAQIAVSLFGTQAEDLGGALDAFDLSTATQQLGQVAGAAQQASDTIGGNTQSAMDSAQRSVEVAVDGMQDSMVKVFGPSVEQFAKFLTDHQSEITQFFAVLGQVAAATVSGVITGFGVMTKIIGLGVSNIGDVIGWVAQGLGKLLNTLSPVVSFLDKDAGQAFKNAGAAIEGFGNDAHSWGEGLDKVANGAFSMADNIDQLSMQMGKAASESTNSKNALKGHQEQLDKSKDSTNKLGTSVDGLGTSLKNLPKNTDVKVNLQQAGGLPGSGSGGGSGMHWWGGGAAGGGTPGRKVGSDQGLLPQTIGLKDQISAQFGNITDIGGWRPPDGYNEHSSGQAIDVMIPNSNTPQGKAYGDQVAAFALQSGSADYVLWQQTQWNADGTSSKMEDRGSPTANHMDHVHVHTRKDGSGPKTDARVVSADALPSMVAATSSSSGGGSSFNWDAVAAKESSGNWSDNNSGGHSTSSGAPRGGLQITDGTWKAFGGEEFAPQANQATKEQQIAVAERIAFTGYNGTKPQGLGAWEVIANGSTAASGITVNSRPGTGSTAVMPVTDPTKNPNLINAFGTGYKAGIGTPGYNEYGEAGYYRTDPKALRQAQQSIEDAEDRVKKADEAVADAKAKAAELDEDSTEEERKTALKQLENAQSEAKRARREAQDAKDDAEETKKGKFTAAQKADKTKADSNGRLGGLGDIAASFFKDTLGLGDLFPDPSQLGIVKIAEALLGIKYTPQGKGMPWQSGYANGDGTPWSGSPDMGLGDYAQVGGTSSAPFGMPNIGVPPPPTDPNVHAGTGAEPGPVTNVTVNAGNTFNGTVGIGPDQIEKQRQASVFRAMPRIPQGS